VSDSILAVAGHNFHMRCDELSLNWIAATVIIGESAEPYFASFRHMNLRKLVSPMTAGLFDSGVPPIR